MSSTTNFEKIQEFHRQFQLVLRENGDFYKNVFDDQKLLDLRTGLIDEECGEMKEAIENKDFVELVDAIGDILYVTYGFAASIGVNADHIFSLIHESNMSKLCRDEEEAKETVAWYKNYEDRYDSPTYKQSSDGKYYIVYNESTGKILKNVYYSPVTGDLEGYLETISK